jgi:hypothetical protein
MEVEMQPEAELEYSSIISIDFPPVDPIVAAAGFAFAFASATASNPPLHTARLGFSDVVSVVLSPLDTPIASTSTAATAHPRRRAKVAAESSSGPWHRYAPGSVPDLFPDYARLTAS